MKKTILFFLICLMVLAGCSSTGQSPSVNSTSGEKSLAGLQPEPAGEFSARFEIQFQGDSPWLYRLDIRSIPPLRETVLHIEGISKSRNPGDIRVVSDGSITRMFGEGTDNECVQFPNNPDMDPAFILPHSLISISELQSKLQYAGEQAVSGANLLHFTAKGIDFGDWTNAIIDVWQDPGTLALTGLSLNAAGNDPFFNAGQGTIKAQYAITSASPDPIEPISGCEISVPLPDTAQMFVRLPGLASFETTDLPETIIRFYQELLPQTGWVESEPLAQVDKTTVLNYARGSEELIIQIETGGPGSKVTIVFN